VTQEVLATYRASGPESLSQLLGGGRAAFDATIPVVAFAVGWYATGRSVPWGAGAAVSVALLVAAWRWRRGVRPRAVLLGILGVCAAAAVAIYTGRAEDFFLIRLVSNAASAVAWALSIVLRWPLLGVVVGAALGQKTRWRRDPALVRGYGRASWVWVFQYLIRLAAFIPLWNIGEVAGLTWAQVLLSWPLVAAVVAVSGVVLWRSLPPGHPGLRHPVTESRKNVDQSMTFTPDVVTAVLRHMNTDHADDCVVICRGLGGQPATTRAVMSDVDADAAYFEATVDDRVVPVRIPFRQRLTERPQIRIEVTWMYHEACERLGIPPERRTNEPASAADRISPS
jgi:hypothetical protein